MGVAQSQLPRRCASPLMQNGANLGFDQPLGHLAEVQVQDGFEGACHVRGCVQEFCQARIGFQLPPEVVSNFMSSPMAVSVLTGEYRLAARSWPCRSLPA